MTRPYVMWRKRCWFPWRWRRKPSMRSVHWKSEVDLILVVKKATQSSDPQLWNSLSLVDVLAVDNFHQLLFLLFFNKLFEAYSFSVGSQHHLDLSLNCWSCWGTTDDFTTSFLDFSLFSTSLWDIANFRPVHSLMLSSHLSFGPVEEGIIVLAFHKSPSYGWNSWCQHGITGQMST